jgi:hypothetical protein
MAVLQFKFAMLEILAKRPDGRASITELWRQWENAENQDRTGGDFPEFESVDLLQSGLVVWQDDCLHITDAGRSVLRALEAFSQQPTEPRHTDQLQSMKAIDDLLGTELRLKTFDLGLRTSGETLNPEPVEDVVKVEKAEHGSATRAALENEAEAMASDLPEPSLGEADLDVAERIDASPAILPTAPAFLNRTAGIRTPLQAARQKLKLPTAFASHFGRFSRILRGHLAEGSSNLKTDGRPVGISGAVFAVLSLVALLVGAGLFIGVSQIKSLKSEVSALERQLAPLKKQGANASQPEKRVDAEQKDQPPIPSLAEKGKNLSENRPTPTGLVLLPDETRLIREYIKPAPSAGHVAPPINIGDPVTIATIPLPSPLTDKIPKLLGARFTIRNGAIVIVKRDSRQADAVLAPN